MYPLVSIISGFYNRKDFVERTLLSLINQSYKNLELIVFDDCSTDETYERIQTFKDKRIIAYKHPSNIGFTKGLINAINNVSKGQFIAIQGSGDTSEPLRIEKQVEVLLDNKKVGVVGGYYDNIVEHSKIVRPRFPKADNTTFDSLRKGNVFTHGEVMFRRSLYENVGGYRPEFQYCQDYDLWLRMIKHCQFLTVKEKIYNRYIQFDGVSYDPKKFLIQARFYLLSQKISILNTDKQNEIIDKLKKSKITDLIPISDKFLQKRIMFACLRLIIWGNYNQALTLSENIQNRSKRFLVKLFSSIYASNIMSYPKKLFYKFIGIKVNV
jgi:glycosyltransferase involved in cell wall biosynthesis